MSALARENDIHRDKQQVRFVPYAAIVVFWVFCFKAADAS